MKYVQGILLAMTFAFVLALIMAGQSLAQVKAGHGRPIEPEPPTLVVRCYASNVTTEQLYDEWNYLNTFAWEQITMRPQSPTLWKVTAIQVFTLEPGRQLPPAPMPNLSPSATVVTCG